MVLHDWGLLPYREARERMDAVHTEAVRDGKNHLILCSHPAVFTVGSDGGGPWPVPVVPTDRGGSVTCHSEGQAVFYFCFQVREPAAFYRRVRQAFDAFFARVLPAARYDAKRPGWYVDRRKVASLGFRYRQGVSLHGVALNVDVDLAFHSLVAPCGLEGVTPTSLAAEGVPMAPEEVFETLVRHIADTFGEKIEEVR